MNGESNWDSAIIAQWKEQDRKSGFNISILEPGTKLVIETRNSFYDVEIIEGKFATIFGGTRSNGQTRFMRPVEMIIHGSTWGGSMLKVDWIGKDMRLEFHTVEDRKQYLTSSVQRVTIESPNGEWRYTMGE
jgi:hypothetical protein